MNILIYSINYFPEMTGIGKYNGEMAEWLAGRGHEVTIITAPPYYPWWRVQPPYRSWVYCTEQVNKVKIHRCPLWVPRQPAAEKRLLHLFSFALASIPWVLARLAKRPDVVVILEPTLFCAPVAMGIARLTGTRTWLHVQDFEVDAALGLGIIKAGGIGRMAGKLERWLMRRFDRVSTISDNMLDRLKAKGVAPERRVLLPNWVDMEDIRPLPETSAYRAELGIGSDICVALYSGNMGEKQGLEILLEAASLLQSEAGILFVLCGEGAARKRLMQAGAGLRNVRWLPLQPAEKLNELLNLADVHLLPQRADVADLVMPSKLLGMLASGRPVLATTHRETQLGKVVSSCGRLVEPGDAKGMAHELLGFLHAPHERRQLGMVGYEIAKSWDKANVLRNFESQLQAMCAKAAPMAGHKS